MRVRENDTGQFVYLFRVRQAEDRWPKTAKVIRHLLMADATYRT